MLLVAQKALRKENQRKKRNYENERQRKGEAKGEVRGFVWELSVSAFGQTFLVMSCISDLASSSSTTQLINLNSLAFQISWHLLPRKSLALRKQIPKIEKKNPKI